MNLNSEKENKFGSDYFSVNLLSFQKRDQLLKPSHSNNPVLITNNPPFIIKNVKKESDYIDALKKNIQFSKEVAVERCVHLLPYSDGFYDNLYEIKKLKNKKKPSIAKLVHPVPSIHHCTLAAKETKLPILPSLKTSELNRIADESVSDGKSTADISTSDFVSKHKKHWDEYIISLMSASTAQYIAFQATHNESQAHRLQDLVQNWYGPAPTYRELVPDDTDEVSAESSGSDIRSTFPYKYYMDLVQSQRSKKPTKKVDTFNVETTPKQKITSLLSREISFNEDNHQTDPYGEGTKAAFYRLPCLLRRQKKNTEILEKDSGNKTVENIKDYVLPSTPPRRLDTVLNPMIGDKILTTDNQFLQDMLINTERNQTKLLNEADNVIMMENKLYRKALQPVWPTIITSRLPSEEHLDCFRPVKDQHFKGHNRWTDLPQREESNLRSAEENTYEEDYERLESRKRVRDHSSVNLIVDQWRKKWQLTQKYNDSTVEALLKDMTDAHPTIRIQAIVTVAKSGSNAISLSEDIPEGQKETIQSDVIPKVLLESIEILLDDVHPQVKKAAAVALHSLEKPTEKSLHILRQMLGSGSNVDRWTACQCLALSNACDSHVIGELVDQLMNSEDVVVHEKASILLAKISFNTKLVHGLLGEKLNTVSWRQRIIICKTLPLLHGSLNKDILRKLIYLMWQDPHKQVRIASSQVIGKTGNGKTVHDELIKKMQHTSETVRADALEKIGILKVMTTRMMPGFLKCFNDDFVIVRKEVCRTCYRLEIQDELCIKKLLGLARYDSNYQVKIYALRALGKIRLENSDIRSCFIWALLYEAETRVRYEAMHSLLKTSKIDKEIVDTLMSRFLVEDDPHITKLLRKTLNSVGINPDEDIDTVSEVKLEVRRFLADKIHITDVILDNEAEEDYVLQRALMLASPEEESSNIASDNDEMYEEESSNNENEVQGNEEYNSSASMHDGGDNLSDHDNVENIDTSRSKDNEEDRGSYFESKETSDLELGKIGKLQGIPEIELADEDNIKDKDSIIDMVISVGVDKTDEEERTSVDDGKNDKDRDIEESIEGTYTMIAFVEKNGEGTGKEEVGEKKGNEKEDEDEEVEAKVKEKCEVENGSNNDDSSIDAIRKEKTDIILTGDKDEIIMPQHRSYRNSKDSTVMETGRDSTIEERILQNREERASVDNCSYVLPRDMSYLKLFSSERSMTWMTLATPLIETEPTQIDRLESTISTSIMDLVNEAIEYEGIDCGSAEGLQ